MRSANDLATALWLCAILVLAIGQALGGKVPTFHECEVLVADIEPVLLVRLALGGEPECATTGDPRCCHQLSQVFGPEGLLKNCMCNEEFFSEIMMGLPNQSGVQPDAYLDMITQCRIPVLGASTCPGDVSSLESQPVIQPMIIGRLILRKALESGILGATAQTVEETEQVPNPPQVPDASSIEPAAVYTIVTPPSSGKKGPHQISPLPPPSIPEMIPVVSSSSPRTAMIASEAESPTLQPSPSPDPPMMPSSPVILLEDSPDLEEKELLPEEAEEEEQEEQEEEEEEEESCSSVTEQAKANPELTTLAQLLEVSGLAGAFGPGFKGTIFAPTDAAFEDFLDSLGIATSGLLESSSLQLVGLLVKYHVVVDAVYEVADLNTGQTIDTLVGGGEALTIGIEGGSVTVSGVGNTAPAGIIVPNIVACNAIVHVINRVLVPSPKIAAFG